MKIEFSIFFYLISSVTSKCKYRFHICLLFYNYFNLGRTIENKNCVKFQHHGQVISENFCVHDAVTDTNWCPTKLDDESFVEEFGTCTKSEDCNPLSRFIFSF